VPSPDPWSSGGVQYVQLLARPGRPFVAETASLSNGSYLPNEPSLGDGLCRTNPKTSRWVMPVCCTHTETGIPVPYKYDIQDICPFGTFRASTLLKTYDGTELICLKFLGTSGVK